MSSTPVLQRRNRQTTPPTSSGGGPLSAPSNIPADARIDARDILASSPADPSRPEADADAKLRLKDEGPVVATAFGGRRGQGRAGAIGGLRRREWIMLAVVCCIASFVRLWNLAYPDSVVFDEVHFGGFAAKYLRRKYFMDVHPPLAKLLVTLSAWIGRFDGQFDFKDIGKDYIEPGVPYIVMRAFPAILGLALVPLTFLTLIALRLSLATALLGAVLITFENALITQSRLILLDSYLVFFTALTIYWWIRFSNDDSEGRAFTKQWWRNLAFSGAALGCVASCKWVGLFTIATVGLGTIRQLWLLLGNLKVTPRMWAKHFAARTLCLIVLPATIYMMTFGIHFWILNMSGDGDGFMSSDFQHTLQGHGMDDTFADVGYGSSISIRHVHTQGGYLHSHPHAYPGGSQQQQITLYPHRDDNNVWRIVNASAPDGAVSYPWDDLPLEYVLTGSKIRLEHISSGKRLHSHDVRPPVSEVEFQNEVSGYGFDGFAGDANDDFIVEIVKETRGRRDKQARHRLRTLRSQFRLRHAMTGCYLFSHKVKLPEWGFEQQEVTCNKNPTYENSLWYIETNKHAQLEPDAEQLNYERPSFFDKFLELQGVMWRTNAGLTDRHAYDSRPQHWPWLRRGINFWVKDHKQVYLIGNPFVWWGSSLAVATYLAFRGLLVIRAKRGYRDLQQPKIAFYDEVCAFLVMGWALHYLPFFLMQRQLFLHHYLPALWFAVLVFCTLFDYATSRIRPRQRFQIAVALAILAIWSFNYFSPLAYAKPWTKTQCNDAKWLKTWDFSCADFHDSIPQYYAQSAISQPAAKVYVDTQSTRIVDEAPEPIKNVFEGGDEAAQEAKTVGGIGPDNEVKMQESTKVVAQPEAAKSDAPKQADDRAPVGLDAGALEVTGAGHDEGGWHGGANDDVPKEAPPSNKNKAPVDAEPVAVPEMDLDAEQQQLAEEAMAEDALEDN